MSTARTFLKSLGNQIADQLDGEYRYLSSKRQLQKQTGPGLDVIILAGSNKWSPDISISFYVGRNFDAARKIEKAIGVFSPPFHIQQYSPTAPKMSGLDYDGPHTWSVDIEKPPQNLVDEICNAIEGIGNPFFERFREIDSARSALIAGDSWCFAAGGHYWHTLLSIDAVTGNIEHFKNWMLELDPLYQEQASERLGKLQQHALEGT